MSISRLDADMSNKSNLFGSKFNPLLAIGGGLGLAELGQLLGGFEDPSKDAMKYIDKIPGQIAPYLNPFIDAGRRSLPGLENEFGSLMHAPGQKLNEIGGAYQQSPGLQFAIQQALQGASHAAAAGGMAGSPQHQQEAMGLATNLANQDYNSWLQHALGLYGEGMGGESHLFDTGYGASKDFSDTIGNMMLQKALLKYQGNAAQQQAQQGATGSLLGGIGSIASNFLFG